MTSLSDSPGGVAVAILTKENCTVLDVCILYITAVKKFVELRSFVVCQSEEAYGL